MISGSKGGVSRRRIARRRGQCHGRRQKSERPPYCFLLGPTTSKAGGSAESPSSPILDFSGIVNLSFAWQSGWRGGRRSAGVHEARGGRVRPARGPRASGRDAHLLVFGGGLGEIEDRFGRLLHPHVASLHRVQEGSHLALLVPAVDEHARRDVADGIDVRDRVARLAQLAQRVPGLPVQLLRREASSADLLQFEARLAKLRHGRSRQIDAERALAVGMQWVRGTGARGTGARGGCARRRGGRAGRGAATKAAPRCPRRLARSRSLEIAAHAHLARPKVVLAELAGRVARGAELRQRVEELATQLRRPVARRAQLLATCRRHGGEARSDGGTVGQGGTGGVARRVHGPCRAASNARSRLGSTAGLGSARARGSELGVHGP